MGSGYLSAISVPGVEREIFKAAHKGKSTAQMMRCNGLITHRLKLLLSRNSTADPEQVKKCVFCPADKWLNQPTSANNNKKKKIKSTTEAARNVCETVLNWMDLNPQEPALSSVCMFNSGVSSVWTSTYQTFTAQSMKAELRISTNCKALTTGTRLQLSPNTRSYFTATFPTILLTPRRKSHSLPNGITTTTAIPPSAYI